MKVTLTVEGTKAKYNSYGRSEEVPYTVVALEEVDLTDRLTASFLRAVADEIDPPQEKFHFCPDDAVSS